MPRNCTTPFTIGLVVNPVAGVGGPAGLKGSDDVATLRLAREQGLSPQVERRVTETLEALQGIDLPIEIITASGSMGMDYCAASASFAKLSAVYEAPEITRAEDTRRAAKSIVSHGVDLLLFAGGDGTARDVYQAIGSSQAVLGLPAGVKMHSGVFAVTPKAVASVVRSMVSGRLVAAVPAEVRDIDEQAFQQGRVSTRHYGEMLVPDDQLLVQSVKCSGIDDDEINLEELCAYLIETMEDDTLYILGSGGTLKHLKQMLGIEEPTLLGVDVWLGGRVIAKDINEPQLFGLIQAHEKCRLLLSVIGGQGVVLGRGNQQISPRIIEHVGLGNVQFVTTRQKILMLEGKPLRLDSGSDDLDKRLSGFHKIICGYEDAILYEIRYID